MIWKTSLFKRAKKGDGEAFVTLIKDYENVLYGTAKRILINEADVQDVMQTTILIAYEKMSTVKKEEYFNTWLYRILINECYRLIKQNNRENNIIYLEESYQNDLSEMELEDLLGSMSDKYRVPLILFYYSKYSLKDISIILDLPLNTVKTRLSRGKQLLKAKLLKEGGSDNEQDEQTRL
ncbi:RNA polymerase sigma factor [Vagococcus silagei]|uniref:Sigma-70 family RNA polymerase sigma factor n=1 Tax=Vagococcus silagei TaxID=2508885 RepID=A0A4S3B5I5_9ENTE|nr:sigma-70 family RNA polymerase sigma factor [Vagococcus silagei]THB62361.1 sigma-70 family RNA polymerase sigma factor [Vagococcus silagei]